MIENWIRSITQPGAADWASVAAYLGAALLSSLAAGRSGGELADRRFWSAITMALVLLAINEPLDLQTLLTAAGRWHALANGWFDARRQVQYTFVAGLSGVAAAASLAVLWRTRHRPAAVRLALVGLLFIGGFVLLRAASFHHVAELLGRGAWALEWGSRQELTGPLIVAAAATFYNPHY